MTNLRKTALPVAVAFALGLSAILTTASLFSQGRPAGRAPATTTIDGREVVAGEALVKYRQSQGAFSRSRAETAVEADEVEPVGRRGVRRLRSRRHATQNLLAMLRANPDVEFAEPNYVIRVASVPNDPSLGNLWGLFNSGQVVGVAGTPGADIDAALAWDISTGSRANVVAVVDTGVDYLHPDLIANMWSAPAPFSVTVGGIVINCLAGSHGFNAISNTCDPMDDNNHGTHVAGTIGAVGNNGIGVAGVNWVASIMALKFLNATGSGTTANAIKAIEFAIQTKAAFAGSSGANVRILSNSWGGGGFSRSLRDEIISTNTNDMLFVAAAGNSADDNDSDPSYPASYNVPNVIAVAATDNRDRLASFSNFGRASVHLGAPGVSILSTIRRGAGTCATCHQASFSGTSMATPHVSGAAALVLSTCSLTAAQLKDALLSSVDPVPSLATTTATGGRLNVYRALQTCLPAITASSVSPSTGSGAAQTFRLEYSDTAGAADLEVAAVWFGTSATESANACVAYYNPRTASLNLLNDAASAWTSGTAGASGSLQNSACSVNLGTSTASLSGTTLTLNLAISFAPAFAGAKNTYVYASRAGVRTGWQPLGAWTVPDSRIVPSLAWAMPANISFGTPLGGVQLNATANVPGTFAYSPAAGTILGVGPAQTLSVTFTPADPTRYAPATDSVPITVSRAAPAVTWPVPANIVVGTPLGATQLSATASVAGSFVYTPAAGTLLSAGAGQTLAVTFSPTNTTNYTPVSVTVPITVVPSVTVTAESVMPNAGAGATQAFTLQYGSSTGGSGLGVAAVWFHTNATTSANSCLIYYSPATGRFNLLDDPGGAWSSGAAGAAGTLRNTACTLELSGSTATVNGAALTLAVSVTFSPAYAGTKNIYLYASSGGTVSGWQTRGTWTVPNGGAAIVTAESVTPNAGSGATQAFTLQYGASTGGSNLAVAAVWFHTNTATAANSCLVYYDPRTGQLHLLDDPGATWTSGIAGAAGTLRNSACTLGLSSSRATLGSAGLTLNITLTFAPAYAGSKNIYLYASAGSVSSGWQALGTWTVPDATAAIVTADRVTPDAGSGTAQVFTLQYAASTGASNLEVAAVWFNNSTAISANSCLAYYSPGSGQFFLLDDAGASWTAGLAGAGGTLQNSACTLTLSSSTATISGTSLALNVALSFAPAFAGSKNVYLYGFGSGATTGWQARGLWTVP